jgi:hypothetical protein
MDVLALLRSKNKCLEKFLSLSADFLEKAEGGDVSGLSLLEERRGACLKAIELYDRKISEAVAMVPPSERTELADAVQLALDKRQIIVEKIVATDAKIIARVEEEKARILTELNKTKKTKNTLGKFKSAWLAESGEGIDTKL